MKRESFLSDNCPPMGIYETLYAFCDSYGEFMGSPGTHPWSQGFPLTTPLPGGPELPASVEVTWEDRLGIHDEDIIRPPKAMQWYSAAGQWAISDWDHIAGVKGAA